MAESLSPLATWSLIGLAVVWLVCQWRGQMDAPRYRRRRPAPGPDGRTARRERDAS